MKDISVCAKQGGNMAHTVATYLIGTPHEGRSPRTPRKSPEDIFWEDGVYGDCREAILKRIWPDSPEGTDDELQGLEDSLFNISTPQANSDDELIIPSDLTPLTAHLSAPNMLKGKLLQIPPIRSRGATKAVPALQLPPPPILEKVKRAEGMEAPEAPVQSPPDPRAVAEYARAPSGEAAAGDTHDWAPAGSLKVKQIGDMVFPLTVKERYILMEKIAARKKRRQVCDVLWICMRSLHVPHLARHLVDAYQLVQKLCIDDVEELLPSLPALLESGIRPFLEADLPELRLAVQTALEVGEGGEGASSSSSRSMAWARHVSDGTPKGDRAAGKRALCDLIWLSRPTWMPVDLQATEWKLARAGVEDPIALDSAISRGLNQRLREQGLKTFSDKTLEAFQRHIENAKSHVQILPGPRSGQAASSSSENMFSEIRTCRPGWSIKDTEKAVLKLERVGVTDISSFKSAIARGINSLLVAAGHKPFSAPTIREFKKRFGLDEEGSLGHKERDGHAVASSPHPMLRRVDSAHACMAPPIPPPQSGQRGDRWRRGRYSAR